ncbi:hypothetical protein BHM03_00044972 [Ensete ventricosum]|uniref:Transmembrane protein n=1 Tax=Ensete ventricosum TaxID=4639 RepID=A0A445MKQ9_ENSVE|nr:hypothetical protein BHM03_00044972 [Ensete ventricosum]
MTKRTRRDVKGTNLYMQPDIVRERCRWWRGHRIPIPFLFHIIAIFLHFSFVLGGKFVWGKVRKGRNWRRIAGCCVKKQGVDGRRRAALWSFGLVAGQIMEPTLCSTLSVGPGEPQNRRLTASSFAVATPCFRHVRESGRNGDDIAGEVDVAGCYRASVFLQPPGVDRPFVVP